jgi:hypothetical protein
MRPISEDALEGPKIATLVSQIYAWTNQSEEAFAQLNAQFYFAKTDPFLVMGKMMHRLQDLSWPRNNSLSRSKDGSF